MLLEGHHFRWYNKIAIESIRQNLKKEKKWWRGGSRLNVRKHFLVVSISLCKADRQGEAVESGFHCSPREIVTVEVLKTKLNSALVNVLQGITPHWARSGQDQLTDLFYVYFLLFLTVRRKLCEGRAQSSLPHLSESRLHYAARSCLNLCSLQVLTLSHHFCSSCPWFPLLLRSTGKNFPERRH